MYLPSRDVLERAAFLASCIAIAFLYGFGASTFGWFPNDLLVRAWHQLETIEQAVWSSEHEATEERVHQRQGARTLDSAAMQPNLTLIPSVWKDFGWKPGLKLIDRDGRVIHRWEVDPVRVFPGEFEGPLAGLTKFNHPQGSYLFPNGDVLVVISRVGTARLDACGEVLWRVRGAHHHSVAPAGDGTFWISASDSVRRPDPITGDGAVRHDRLVHLSEDGEVLDEIEVFDILRENEELLRRHLRYWPSDTHLNDVEPLPASMEDEYPAFDAGDLLVSLRHLNLVFVVDPTTLEVEWWVGEPFIYQHDPDFVGDGWIGVFDNYWDGTDRGTRLGGSRVVAFRPSSDSTAVWFQPSESTRFYTRDRGNWQLLDNGNLLITESTAGRVAEVDAHGELVWEWVQPPYDDGTVPRVYWAERYDIGPAQTSSWPCSPDDAQSTKKPSAPLGSGGRE